MDYRFYLDDLEIEEPIGFADFELSLKRDEKYHGIQFEASTGSLQFYGAAAEYLRTKKETLGLKANVTFTAEVACDAEFEQVYQGRLNFGKYKDTCGSQCVVSIPVEEDSCRVVFKNKFDQKVDIDNTVAFDGISLLGDYAALGIDIDLPAKSLDVRAEGYVAVGGDTDGITDVGLDSGYVHIRPRYQDERFISIQTSQIANPAFSFSINQAFGGPPPSPQVLFEDNISCFDGEADYILRLKGSFSLNGDNEFLWAKLRWLEYNFPEGSSPGSLGPDATVIQEFNILPPTGPGGHPRPSNQSYDQTFGGTVQLKYGYGYYAVLELAVLPGVFTISNTFDVETHFTLAIKKTCPTTTSDAYLIHETLSRVTESVTNNCIRVKSAYYGRVDSQPFSFDQDGCGGLRMLTSGLKIRRAPEDKFFASPKDLIEGLNGIDNLGFSIDPDESTPGKFLLRIEPVEEFYLDEEILALEAIAEGNNEVQESMHYSKVNVGYKKWEVEGVNGLDEFNSTREYRTSLETVSNTLDITTNLVAGSYPIEITRQQSFAESGAADTKFDNDIFIITLIRNAYDFEAEQDNVDNAANFFDPATVYNFRLSPIRNLMRWYKSIGNSYVNLSDAENKLFFSAGTGNLAASGEISAGDLCKLENMPLSESQNLFVTHFANEIDYTPLWKNETFSAEYPLSVAEYNQLRQNPYGYINYQCGNGDYEKGFIKEVKFKPAKGIASFTLIKKWE